MPYPGDKRRALDMCSLTIKSKLMTIKKQLMTLLTIGTSSLAKMESLRRRCNPATSIGMSFAPSESRSEDPPPSEI